MVKKLANTSFLTLIIFSLFAGCNTTFFYHPTRLEYFNPDRMGFPSRDIWIKSNDGTSLHGFHIGATGLSASKNTLVLFFHGNAENISSHFISVAWMADRGYDLMMFDYRGFGRSDGEIAHSDVQDDVLAMLRAGDDFARRKGMKFVVYGQSLGGILAANGLIRWKSDPSYRQPDLLVLDSTFSSYSSIGASKMRGCLLPAFFLPYLILSDRHAVSGRLGFLAPLPLLVVHGDADDTVPMSFGRELFDEAGEPKRLIIVKGASHASWAGLGRSPIVSDFLSAMGEMLQRSH